MAEPQILITQKGHLAVIQIAGGGADRNAFPLKTAYQELLKKGVTDFVIDLSGCEFLDDTFLGILLGFGLEVKQQKSGHIRVFNVNNSLMDLFRGVGLDRLFTLNELGVAHLPPTSL